MEQLLHQTIHPRDVGSQLRKLTVSAQGFERAGHDGPRRTKLMRNDCDELILHPVRLLHFPVEACIVQCQSRAMPDGGEQVNVFGIEGVGLRRSRCQQAGNAFLSNNRQEDARRWKAGDLRLRSR